MTTTLLSKRIKSTRIAAKLTQKELGERVGTNLTSISNYENGYNTPSNQVLVNLANVLEVSTDYLLGRTSEDNLNNEGDIYLDGVKITESRVFIFAKSTEIIERACEKVNNNLKYR